ncbi:cupin domain-containing protein [Paraburkholderia sp. RL18-085-BIA-A]|uniref:hypothetical protein n=2 Tax=unclassified Paraburkholderia TaxID=2615204 RepID=UPI0038B75021
MSRIQRETTHGSMASVQETGQRTLGDYQMALHSLESEAIECANPEAIYHEGSMLGMILPDSYSKGGVNFFTPDNFSQQLAYIEHPRGTVIPAHIHNHIVRQVEYTQEVLFVKRGRLRVDFYATDRTYVTSRTLGAGDVILLASGGHGFEILEDASFVEVKQGPYLGGLDKVRFDPHR